MRPAVRDLAIVLGVSWIARGLFVALIGDAHSLDVDYWQGALSARAEGTNPYETGVLNWPPLWLEIIVALNAVASLVDVSFLAVLRIYLIAVESMVVVTLYLTLVSTSVERAAVRRALLVGLALNPVMIILVCQHGNSDVNVALFVTLACAALIAFRRTGDVAVWLGASLLLGLGVLAKTTPLVLGPLLAAGARTRTRAANLLGATLLLLPATVGLAVLVALVPRAVLDHVIEYRTRPGNFGFPGAAQGVTTPTVIHELVAISLLATVVLAALLISRVTTHHTETLRVLIAIALGMIAALVLGGVLERVSIDARGRYSTVFTLALLLFVSWLWRQLRRKPALGAEEVFLLVAVIFMSVVAFGTGYGAHYAPWFLPALVATYVLLDDSWRRLLVVAYVIAATTYVVEYASVSFLGASAAQALGSSRIVDLGAWLEDDPIHWGALRIPLSLAYLVVIAAGVARIRCLFGGRDTGTVS